jgi:hypothetical protein
MKKLPNIKKPCANCPFRKDSLKGWIGEDRMTDILESDSFVCHKTVNHDLDKDMDNDRKQCAGFMLLKDEESTFVRLAKVLQIGTGLTGRELVFDNKQDCINHHKH